MSKRISAGEASILIRKGIRERMQRSVKGACRKLGEIKPTLDGFLDLAEQTLSRPDDEELHQKLVMSSEKLRGSLDFAIRSLQEMEGTHKTRADITALLTILDQESKENPYIPADYTPTPTVHYMKLDPDGKPYGIGSSPDPDDLFHGSRRQGPEGE